MQDKYRYLTKNMLIFAISSFGTKFLAFFLTPLYTHVLTTGEYGVADLITTTSTLLMYIFTINISDSVLRFAIERKENQSVILGFGLQVLGLGSLVLLGCLTVTALSGLVQWEPAYYLFVFLYYLATAIYQIFANYLRAIDRVVDVAMAGIFSAVSMLLSNLLFLLVIRIGLYGYLISLVMGPLVGWIYCAVKARIPVSAYFHSHCDPGTKWCMVRYCVPLIFNNIALWINAFLDKYFVTMLCGVDQNGIYSVANKIPTILSTCYLVFSQAWNLSAIKEFDADDKENFFSDTYRVYNAAVAVVCSALILVNIPVAKVLFSKDFFTAWQYSSVLLISVMFNALTSFLGGIFTAVKNSRIIAVTTVVSAGVNILLNAVLIPLWGVMGAAVATAAAYMVMWIVRLLVARRYIRLRIQWVRDVLVYLLLVGQVILEHLPGHGYIGQAAAFLLIVFLYHKPLWIAVRQFAGKFFKKGRQT